MSSGATPNRGKASEAIGACVRVCVISCVHMRVSVRMRASGRVRVSVRVRVRVYA